MKDVNADKDMGKLQESMNAVDTEEKESNIKVKEAEEQNKKDDKKYFKPFIIMMIICTIVGFFFGKLTKMADEHTETIKNFMENLNVIAAYALPALFLVFNIVMTIMIFRTINRQYRRINVWDGEDEDILDDIENKLNSPLNFSNVMLLVGMFLFAAHAHYFVKCELPELHENILFATILFDFVTCFIIALAAQKKIVNLLKIMNPEKKGSIFDSSFRRKWEESSDEGQQLIIYKSAYKAFIVSNTTCMVLWVVGIICDFAFHTGLLPIAFVILIWFIQVITAYRESVKLEGGRK